MADLDIPRLLSGIAPRWASKTACAVDAGWVLSVSDDGIGISQPQSRAGLGTSLLEEFARQAGGTLSIQASNGTLARLTLPLALAQSSARDDTDI